jgi:putative DNA primase/helicase
MRSIGSPAYHGTLIENFTDLGNARRLVHRFADDIRYCHAFKNNGWFIWDDDYWRRDDNGEINRRAEQTIEALLQEALAMDKKDPQRDIQIAFALRSEERSELEAMIALARNDYRAVLDYKKLDADPLLVGVLNGVIDLRTGEFRRGRREDFISKRCSITYDPEATCPNWEEFQEKIAGGHDGLVAYKRRALGILLSGEVPEILFIAHGDGSNGKTTELETIADILGDYSQAADASLLVTAKERGGPTPEIVVLRGKRAVFVNETEAKDWLNEQRVKYLAGTDEMAGRGLYENQINWKPTHKPWLRTNHKPKIRGQDLGIWRRIHYIPYITTISEGDAIKNFREKMLVPEHAGIFNWMLEGWKQYLANERKLMPPPCVQESTAAYRKEMDHTGRWLEQGVEPFAEGKAFLKSIYAIYRDWFKNEIGDYGAVSIQKLAERLEQAGYRRDHNVKGGATIFYGLSLKVFGDTLLTAEQINDFVVRMREQYERRIDDNR